jgi:hypothetical protein
MITLDFRRSGEFDPQHAPPAHISPSVRCFP